MGGTYPTGTAVTITQTFTVLGVDTDPTTVEFTVQDPQATDSTFVFGVDAEVTNPAVGVYVLELTAPGYPGVYHYDCVGTGAVEATGNGIFTVLPSTVSPVTGLPYPQVGPCAPWIDCDDITDSCTVDAADLPLLDGIAAMASHIMFEISGRQFTGNCEKTVRPCNLACSCWDNGWNGWFGSPWSWGNNGSGWGWFDGFGTCHCSCDSLSRVKLSGYPVTQILEVKIDGAVIANTEYRLDEWTFLTRMRDSADPNTELHWPSCQILDLDDTEAGTWSVTYLAGMEPPLAGKAAAVALACELLPSGDCKLPSGAVKIVRNGIQIDRLQPLSSMLLQGMTGIVAIDAFMASVNSSRLRRRPTTYSPNRRGRYARPVGP
jgi:hypothetical protein